MVPVPGRLPGRPQDQDADGRYILEQDITAEGAERLFGIGHRHQPHPHRQGRPRGHEPGGRGPRHGPTVVIDSSRYFDTDEVALRVVARFDLALLQPKAVTVLTAA